jgi:hypothetical protein
MPKRARCGLAPAGANHSTLAGSASAAMRRAGATLRRVPVEALVMAGDRCVIGME